MFGHVIHKFRYIALFLLILFCFTSNSAFALEQMKPVNVLGNWQSINKYTNTYNAITGAVGTDYLNLSYATQNARGDGLYYQTVTTPSKQINIKLTLKYQTYHNNRTPTEYYFYSYFGTNTTNNQGTQIFSTTTTGSIMATGNNYNTNTTTATVEKTIDNATTNTTYYFKNYLYVRFGNGNNPLGGVKIYNASCNFSPIITNASTDRSDGILLNFTTNSSPVATLKGYNIYRSTTSGSGYTKINPAPVTGNTYLDASAVLNTDYYYVITDLDTNNTESPQSKQVQGRRTQNEINLNGFLYKPDAWNQYARLSWVTTPDNPQNQYYLERANNINSAYTDLGTWGSNLTCDDQLSASGIYFYRVRYQRNGAWSAYSNVENVLYAALKVTNTINTGTMTSTANVSWNAINITGRTGYQIYKSSSPDGVYTKVGEVGANVTSWTDSNPTSGPAYYKITVSTDTFTSNLSEYANVSSPTNLKGTYAATNRVTLTWSAPDPANTTHGSYSIYRSTSMNSGYTRVANNVSALTYTDNRTVTAGQVYYYVVADVDWSGNLLSISNITAVGNLNAPNNLKATLNGTSVNLTWTATTTTANIKGYNIYRSTTSGTGYTLIGSTTGRAAVNYTDNDTELGTTYYYVVTAVNNNGGESAYSNEANATIPSLNQPTNLTASLNASLKVDLNWTATTSPATMASGYNIYRSTTSGSGYVLIGSVTGRTTTAYTDTTADLNTTYYYVVTTQSTGSTESGYSNEANITTPSINPPTNLTASIDGSNNLVLAWTATTTPASVVKGYNIYRSTTSGSGYTLAGRVSGSTTVTFIDTSIDPNTTYYYVARTETNDGTESGNSNEATVTIPRLQPPTNLSATSDGSPNINLTWTATTSPSAIVKGYNIYRSTTNGSGYTLIGSVTGSDITTFADTSTNLNTTYYYVVRTVANNNSESDNSNQASATTPATIPAPTLSSVVSETELRLQWSMDSWPTTRIDSYEIYRSTTSGGPYTKIDQVAGSISNYLDSTAAKNTEYFYVIKAKDISGAISDYSNEVNGKMVTFITITAHIDSSVLPEIVLTSGDVANIPLNWTVDYVLPGLTITGYSLGIMKSSGDMVQTSTAPAASTSGTVNNVILRNGESYLGYLEVFYSVDGNARSSKFYTSESFSAVTPTTMVVRVGWSGLDTAYTFFTNRVEANWDYNTTTSVIKYEIAVGTNPYSNDVVDWQDIGLPNRIAITTPELASGTRYYTSVRGVNQNKNIVISGCSDGFTARRDPVVTDTDASEFFNNARVLENLTTSGGCLTPSGEIANGNWKYCMPITVTEPDVTDRINAPCLVSFTIPAGQRPGNTREFRVVDDRGNVVPRYIFTNSTTTPGIVFLVTMSKGETRTYYVYWGDNTATEPAYGFKNNTYNDSFTEWTPYYSRKNMPAGLEDIPTSKTTVVGNTTNYDDTSVALANFTELTKFKYFGTDLRTGWNVCTNGFMDRNKRTTYTNSFNTFTNNSSLGKCIAPLWADLYVGTSWNESGIFRHSADNPKRLIITWVCYKYQHVDEAYKMQAVLYQTGDIALRYGVLNPGALIAGSSTDKAVNTDQKTVGISNCDTNSSANSHWLVNVPLNVGINLTPTAFYQCMDAFEDTTVYGAIVGNGTDYEIAHFESMVFDTKVSNPQWDKIEYDATISGSRKLKISYRTGNTELPDSTWTAWSTAQEAATTVTGGVLPVTTTGRYIQYKVEFLKTGTTGTITLNEVRFIYGGISIEQVAAVKDGEPVTEVTQGETDIPVTVSIKNLYTQPVTLANSAETQKMTFTLGGHVCELTSALPITIAPNAIATLTYFIDIDDAAPTGLCTIDALATATYNTTKFTDDGAQIPLTWIVKSKSVLKIDKVYSDRTEVTKGQSGIPLGVYISNLGEADCIFDFATPTVSIGQYTFTFVGPATGTTIIPGNGSIIATFAVSISRNSESGSDVLNAVASATNKLSGEKLEIIGSDNPHVWMIQNPADLVLMQIIASDTVYRGQKNNAIILRAQNMGEAEMEWHTSESTIAFIPHVGTYENLRKESPENVVNLLGNEIADSMFMVDITADTATGTDMIDGNVYGTELNTMGSIAYEDGAIAPGQWTIYAEKVNTYKDAGFANETNSFNKPVGTAVISVYMRAENLSSSEEYRIHWYDPDGNEIVTSEPRSGDEYSNVYYEYQFNSSAKSGIYKIEITNALNTIICCQNTFEIVSPASMLASFTIPAYVTLGQTFNASFTYINGGGAVIESATLAGAPTKTGTGGITVLTESDGSYFTPKFTDVPGLGQATATYRISATTAGNVTLRTSASGIDANSGKVVEAANINSNQCVIQTAPNIAITLNNLPAATVYLNQKNLSVTATIKNNGQATAIINTASITCNIGKYEQELTSTELPFELAGGASKTLTFTVNVAVDSPSGADTLRIQADWYDKNWPESGIQTSTSNTKNWTISPIGIILSSDPDFNTEQSDFCPGQTVYIKAYGVNPESKYYRIRLYASQITPSTTVPTTGHITTNQGYSGMLMADSNGYVFHQYLLPTNTKIGTYSIVLEDAGGTYSSTLGSGRPLMCLQYFRVQNNPTLQATITIDDSEDIFVDDTFNVTMTIRSTAANSAAVDNIAPNNLLKAAGATGNAILVSGPDPATFSLRAGESKTFTYTFKATEQTGDTGVAANRFKLTTSGVAAEGMHQNLWTSVTAPAVTSNGLIIYSEAIGVTPNPLVFGTLVCGEIETASDFTVLKLGNYPAKNIRLNAADFNGPVIDGTMARISKAYFTINPEQIDNLDRDKTIEVHINVPYNQQAGSYSTTMFVYSDENGNGVFDSGEITAEFKASVAIDSCWLLVATDKFTDMGDWPKGSKGTITSEFDVSFFNAGNMPLNNVKIKPTPEASATFDFLLSETSIGALPIGESHTVKISANTAKTSPEPASGIYIATFTVWEDDNNDGFIQPSEPKDTFQVKISIGDIGFEITPGSLQADPVDTSRTAYSGVLPGFDNLIIRNTGELALTRIKLQVGSGTATSLGDGAGHYIAPGNIIIAPDTLIERLERNNSDEFSLAAFVPAGTYSTTYNSILYFYSDDNRNNVMDPQEYRQSVTFRIHVSPTRKIQVIQKTVTLGGVMSDPVVSTQKLQNFSCRNIGNIELSNLCIIPQNLVHQIDDTTIIEAYNASFPPHIWFNCEGVGNFFYPTVLLTVPAGTDDGVYITSNDCVIFEDLNRNGIMDPDEASDTFKIMVEVGQLKIEIDRDELKVNGEPQAVSTSDAMYITNTGSLDVTNVTGTATVLVGPGGFEIPASASLFSPKNAGSFIGGQSKAMNWSVDVPENAVMGTYTCTITAWADSNGNGKIDSGEAIDTATGRLYVKRAMKIDIVGDTLEIGETLSTNTTVNGSAEIKSTGNQAVTDLKTILSPLKLGSSTIATSSISLSLQDTSIDVEGSILATFTISMGTEILATGIYSGEQTVYCDINGNGKWDSDEPGDTVVLKVTIGEKELTLSPDPLDFGNLAANFTDSKTVQAQNTGSANLRRVRAIQDAPCDCGCTGTTISLRSPTGSVAIRTGNRSDFILDINVGESTKAGQHVEKWRFFDDDNNNGVWDEATNEYSVLLEVRYFIEPTIKVRLSPASSSVTLAKNSVATMTYTLTNMSNTELDTSYLAWSWNNLYSSTGSYLPALSTITVISMFPTEMLGIGSSTTCLVQVSVGDVEEGVYSTSTSPASSHELRYMAGTVLAFADMKITVGNDGPTVPSDCVHQQIASSTFEDCNIATVSYFLSAWVCTTNDEPAIGELSLVRYSSDGRPKSAVTVCIDNERLQADAPLTITNPMVFLDGSEAYPVDGKLYYNPDVSSPVGICGAPITATEGEGDGARQLQFFRIYVNFKVGIDTDTDECDDTFRIVLSQRSGATNTRPTKVYFDGIKLEKSFAPDQEKPTTYHQGATLFSPSYKLDMGGRHQYYEW